MEYLTIHIFRQIVKPYAGDRKIQTSSYLNQLIPEAGTFYVMDRGYLDFTRQNQFHQSVDSSFEAKAISRYNGDTRGQ